MAKSRASETSTGLVVSLVIAILLCIILAGTTFWGFSSAGTEAKKATENETSANQMKSERDKARVERAAVKAAAGIANKDDTDVIQGQKSVHQDVFTGTLKSMNDIRWDPAKDRPDQTYAEVITDLRAKVKTEQDKMTDQGRKLQEAVGARQQAEDAARKAKTDYDTRVTQLNADFVKLQGTKADEYQKALDIVAEREKKLKELQDQVEMDKENQEQQVAKLNESIKALQLKMQRMEADNPASAKAVNLLEHDQPKGHLVSVDLASQTVYINLGSADNVKPQLTFSVYGKSLGKARGEPKATIEVTSVLRDHLSAAKITSTNLERNIPTMREFRDYGAEGKFTSTDRGRQDPLVRGDLIFNPAWNPSMRERVAIAGFIDLTGDGRDGTLEFKQQLERQGVVVDGYLDLRDLAFKGRLTENTSYLITGEMPEISEQDQVTGTGTRVERAREMNVKLTELRQQANRLGVTVIPVRRFMALMGFRPPRNAFTSDRTDLSSPYMRSTIRPASKPATPDPGKPPDEDKPMEETKPSGKPAGKPAKKPGDEDKP